MRRRRSIPVWRSLFTALILTMLVSAGGAVAASRDRQSPSAPGNVRVTGTTPYGISLAWDASRDNVGVTSYVICCSSNSSQTVAAPATGATFGAGVESGRTYTLVVYARDAAGNWSKASNSVTATTPRDTTPPATPVVTVTDVGPTHVSLAWSTVENGPNVWFTVLQDGSPVLTGVRTTSADFGFFEPQTTHTFSVQAMDFGGNRSAFSPPVSVTTEARDTTDTTPPSVPGNLHTTLAMPDGETWLSWTQSTDDLTLQSLIRYDVFVNGVFDSGVMGFGRQIVYGTPLSFNEYSVVAVDESGNRSAPATIVVDNR